MTQFTWGRRVETVALFPDSSHLDPLFSTRSVALFQKKSFAVLFTGRLSPSSSPGVVALGFSPAHFVFNNVPT
jgi:hypothetical protein